MSTTVSAPTDEASQDPDRVEEVFTGRYLERAATWLPNWSPAELERLAADHFAFGRQRRPGQTLVRVRELDEVRSAVEVVTDDAPYLVDSLQTELRVSGHPMQNILHPQLIVSRDAEGRLTHVFDLPDTAELPAGAVAESWLHAEITAVPADERGELAAVVGSVLADVHHAVDDAPELYRLIRELADTLRDHPGQFDRDTSAEAGSLLRWLADGNFMILGHVSYSANELATAATSGLRPPPDPQAGGVLRGDAHISVVELLPAFRSGAPVVIFKSALMSTVLRGGPLRLRHRRRTGARQRAAAGARVPRPVQRDRRRRRTGAGAAPADQGRAGPGRRSRQQLHRSATDRGVADASARRAARGRCRRPGQAGHAGIQPGPARRRRGVLPAAPEPRLHLRARLPAGRAARSGDDAPSPRWSSARPGRARSSPATSASPPSAWPGCTS